jgi:hypothetical protein
MNVVDTNLDSGRQTDGNYRKSVKNLMFVYLV